MIKIEKPVNIICEQEEIMLEKDDKIEIVEDLTIQHIIPRCIGGKTNYENLEILCFKCNIQDYHLLVKKALEFYFKFNK